MGLAQVKVDKIGINYIEDYYNAFLNSQKESTMKAYRTALKLFFKVVYGKEALHVTIDDLKNTKMIDAMKFYNWLKEKVKKNKNGEIILEPRYKNASINKHINGAKGFFRFMHTEFEDINPNIFNNIETLDPSLDSNGWDGLDWQEAIQIWEYAGENFGEESNQLSMLFKIASITSIRLDALINSTWEDNWFQKNERGVVINYIQVQDKSKIHKKPVSEEFYNELRDKLGTEGRLFPNMYPNKVGERLKETIKALGFDPRRNIKFHSFKKAGVMRALEKTGNMYKAKEQGNHSSMTTAEKYYLKYKECLMDMTSFTMDIKIDMREELADYSKDDIVMAIDKMSDGAKYELLRILEERDS